MLLGPEETTLEAGRIHNEGELTGKIEPARGSPTKILFLTTTHNSLSQRLYLALKDTYTVSIEYALSETVMKEAVDLFRPDLVICPFLTARVPKEIFDSVMTLIIHPGPPGDRGPSSLDWLIMGDSEWENAEEKRTLSSEWQEDVPLHYRFNADYSSGEMDEETVNPRTHWGVSIIQAVEKLDTGPVWAFGQFPVNIDEPGLTKSTLYRGPVTRVAIQATLVAITRLTEAQRSSSPGSIGRKYLPTLQANSEWNWNCIFDGPSFKCGHVRERPLLKAADREFDAARHTSTQISRRIRSGDSQPGAQSKIFGPSLYVYGGIIEDLRRVFEPDSVARLRYKTARPGHICMVRNGAVCIKTIDEKGVWITHIRRLKKKTDKALWPKVNAVFGLFQLAILSTNDVSKLELHPPRDHLWGNPHDFLRGNTFQEIWVDRVNDIDCVYFDFYNGAMSTAKCVDLLSELRWIVSNGPTPSLQNRGKKSKKFLPPPPRAIVLMGGSYFSNGIDLNTIEASADPPAESWTNINAMDDLVAYILAISRDRGILTVAAPHGNAAAGGVALLAACDYVICDAEVVLNPAYRGIGLYGSEFHTISYRSRCGEDAARRLLRDMLPCGPRDTGGLVDDIYDGEARATNRGLRDGSFDSYVRAKVRALLDNGIKSHAFRAHYDMVRGVWTSQPGVTGREKVARARAAELAEMTQDFWGSRSQRYHARRYDFVRKVVPGRTPLRFAVHRRGPGMRDEEERDEFDENPMVGGGGVVVAEGTGGEGKEIRTGDPAASRNGSGHLFACSYGGEEIGRL